MYKGMLYKHFFVHAFLAFRIALSLSLVGLKFGQCTAMHAVNVFLHVARHPLFGNNPRALNNIFERLADLVSSTNDEYRTTVVPRVMSDA